MPHTERCGLVMHRRSKAIDITPSQCEDSPQGPHQGNSEETQGTEDLVRGEA